MWYSSNRFIEWDMLECNPTYKPGITLIKRVITRMAGVDALKPFDLEIRHVRKGVPLEAFIVFIDDDRAIIFTYDYIGEGNTDFFNIFKEEVPDAIGIIRTVVYTDEQLPSVNINEEAEKQVNWLRDILPIPKLNMEED